MVDIKYEISMSNKTAIITGITGQDGAYLAKFLLGKDYNVIGVTRSRNNLLPKKLKYLGIEGPGNDGSFLAQLVSLLSVVLIFQIENGFLSSLEKLLVKFRAEPEL